MRHKPVVSENANVAEISNPGGVVEIRGDQPTRHWVFGRRARAEALLVKGWNGVLMTEDFSFCWRTKAKNPSCPKIQTNSGPARVYA